MKAHVWVLTRLAAVLFWAVSLGALVYWVVFPTVIGIGYRVAGTKLDRFELQGGEGAAGSEDAVYFAARYDCRKSVTRIVGTPVPRHKQLYNIVGLGDQRESEQPSMGKTLAQFSGL